MEPVRSSPQSQVPASFPLCWTSSIQSIPARPTSWRSSLILPFHLLFGLPSCLFPSGIPHQNPVYASPLPHTRYIPRPSLTFFTFTPNFKHLDCSCLGSWLTESLYHFTAWSHETAEPLRCFVGVVMITSNTWISIYFLAWYGNCLCIAYNNVTLCTQNKL